MLQDLDQLAARLGQLVQRTRQLHAERDALRARLNDSEAQQRALQQRCAERDAELQTLREKLQAHDQAASDLQAGARQVEEDLRKQLANETAQRQALEARVQDREAEWQSSLQSRDVDLQRLRSAASAARERIDAVLARLPGASIGEQP